MPEITGLAPRPGAHSHAHFLQHLSGGPLPNCAPPSGVIVRGLNGNPGSSGLNVIKKDSSPGFGILSQGEKYAQETVWQYFLPYKAVVVLAVWDRATRLLTEVFEGGLGEAQGGNTPE